MILTEMLRVLFESVMLDESSEERASVVAKHFTRGTNHANNPMMDDIRVRLAKGVSSPNPRIDVAHMVSK